MAKSKSLYFCNACGGQSLKWQGQCPHCREWNTLVEGVAEKKGLSLISGSRPTGIQSLNDIEISETPRLSTTISEFDRVLGGGLVLGGVVLLGGDPGIGKSTLLLQTLSAMSIDHRVLYVSGEESAQQIALRARRLNLDVHKVSLLTEIHLENIHAMLNTAAPAITVIDSIQTIYSDALQSAPGSVAQVRECAAQLTRIAKSKGICMTKKILIVSLLIAIAFHAYYSFTGDGGVLAFELIGLLVAFTCSMLLLTEK